MKILYVATDQDVPGTQGGSVHIVSVARGLASLGHEVHVLARPPRRSSADDSRGLAESSAGESRPREFGLHPIRLPLGARGLRLATYPAVLRLARAIGPDVIIERYYNFGGEGVLAAGTMGVPAVLEVNSPAIDHPGSAKRVIDRALLAEPFRRWRERLFNRASLVVAPVRQILPPGVAVDRVLEIEWGADTDLFTPPSIDRAARQGLNVRAIFAGAFRAWHGVPDLLEAARLIDEARAPIDFYLVGHGPEFGRAQSFVRANRLEGRVTFTGPVPHERMPALLADADVGVAPFSTGRHAQLQLGFYWSPLKVFEYMASGLPVVAPAIPRLQDIVRSEREGLLYREGDPASLTTALIRLANDRELRRRLGAAARARAVERYSWRAHCTALDRALRALTSAAACAS